MALFLRFPTWITPEIVPGIPVRWFSITYIIAFAIAWLMTRRAFATPRWVERTRLSPELAPDLFFYTVIGGLIGSRVAAMFLYDPELTVLREPWIVLWPFDDGGRFVGLQGMSFHGGLLGGAVTIVAYVRRHRLNLLWTTDLAASIAPIGIVFVRIGSFINEELFGRVTALPWGVVFPSAPRVPASHPAVREIAARLGLDASVTSFLNLPRHPSPLYEAIAEGLVLWLIVWGVVRPRARRAGSITGVYLFVGGALRLALDYLRMPDPAYGFVTGEGLPGAQSPWLFSSLRLVTRDQILSGIVALAGALLLVRAAILAGRRPVVETYLG